MMRRRRKATQVEKDSLREEDVNRDALREEKQTLEKDTLREESNFVKYVSRKNAVREERNPGRKGHSDG